MEALENAIKIIKNEKRDPNYNTLYLFTNENLNELTEKLYLENKKIITVCSSGDQFFNFLVKHPKDIMLYDINPLTEYLFYLKKAAIENLDYDAFKSFFLDKKIYNKYLLSKDIYKKIKEDIPDKIKYFWDELYKKYDNYALYKSNLFYTIRNSPKSILNNNNYLKDENIYYKLKILLKKITEIKYYNINIFEEFLNENNKFDFIYVSNILDYLNIDNEKEYYIKLKKIITKLSKTLNTNGETI